MGLWINSCFFALVELDSYSSSGWATIFAILIPAILVFYTIGWRAKNKTTPTNTSEYGKFCKKCGEEIVGGGYFCQSCGNKLYDQ